jgi:hypothetical protein
MRRFFSLVIGLSLTSACFSKETEDDDDDDGGTADELTSDWGDGADGSSDGADGSSDGADGGDLSSDEAATLLADGLCDWVGTCYGYEAVGMRDHDECVLMQADALLSEFSDCDVDTAALRDCLDELERAERECDDPGVACSVEEICP